MGCAQPDTRTRREVAVRVVRRLTRDRPRRLVREDASGGFAVGPASVGTHPGTPRTEGLDRTISRATRRLLGLQHNDGYWWGELEANCAITAEYLLLTHFMGLPNPDRWKKIAHYLKRMQGEDGGWPIWHGGPGDLSIAVECYFALKLAGTPHDDPSLVRARAFILEHGGVARARVFTKMWLALFGQCRWQDLPVVPVEIMHLPSWSWCSIYDFASWARGTIVACAILLARKPRCSVPESARLDELHPKGGGSPASRFIAPGRRRTRDRLFMGVHRGLRLLDAGPIAFMRRPLRDSALRKAERWILDRQNADGSWGGIQPPWVYSLMALHTLGYDTEHPVIKLGIAGFDGFARETDATFRIDPCISPVWDTCLASVALQDAGVPPEAPCMVRAAQWLLDKQILERGGDWQVRRGNLRPGGWAFEFVNDLYPDVDDTALAMIALHGMRRHDDWRIRRALRRGRDWLEGMQSRNGGWGAFDADNAKRWVTSLSFCDFGNVTDPPSEDVTAHAVEALGLLGFDASRPAVRKGLDYLKATQQEDGSWWGRWGVNYVYGIGAVLPALRRIGEHMDEPYIQKALDWLVHHQHADGGWGEDAESYLEPSLRGQGPSTKSQTAWALLGLIAGGRADSESARRGVGYLVRTQREDGSWDEPEFTGTGFPRDFMLRYHMYRDYWPLMALSRYRGAGANTTRTVAAGAARRA